MKTLATFLLAALLASSSFAADSAPVFNALLAVGNDHRFVLVSSIGKVSPFLRVGESFDGYVLKGYEQKSGVLTLERDGKAVTLSLSTDSARNGGGAVGSLTPGTLADATAVLEAMNFEVMLDKILDGTRKQQGKMIDQLMGQVGAGGADREVMSEFQKRAMDVMMEGLTGAEMKSDMAKAYSEVFSKEELQALGSFYASPLGKSFSEKQPDLSEKMNAIIMPRMMANMPKLMQFTQQFGKEQRAKRDAARAAAAAAQDGVAVPPAPGK